MATLKEKRIKNGFKEKAQKNPEKYYPVKVLKDKGFKRYKCKKCGSFYWSFADREICGDPNCSGKYQFINNSPIKPLEYLEVWQRFSKLFKKHDYTPIRRYPIVARWREDIYFVEASIDDFIPHVLSGESEPPFNPLTVPQFCIRFNDIDNVGITGRHNTGFVMIGQHAFASGKDYSPEQYLTHILEWLIDEIKIPCSELQFHEDAWAGSGKMGPSIEFFSRGLELGNQVYMQYDIRNGIKELNIKTLDMGMGQERYAWLSHGTNTSYDVVFPSVAKKLFSITGIKPDRFVWSKFLPYSGMLNLDEVDSIEKVWQNIAKEISIDVKELKEKIIPISALYAIGDHARSLLVAINDGCLPSNVGGGYNLRVILRRSLDFISKYNWDISLPDLCKEHALYLKKQYPELMENLDEISRILEFEEKKYNETKKKTRKIISTLSADISESKLIELYDSHGISPDIIADKLKIKIPEDFYKKVSERHENIKTKKEKEEMPEYNVPETEKIYYENEKLYEFSAKVLKAEGEKIILDRTAFYPRGGGAEPDLGTINGHRVYNVEKAGNIIIHFVEGKFKEGETVNGKINKERREAIRNHHTAVHILNLSCRRILGNHIWQAGSYKDDKKARLDITHYKNLTTEEMKEIERMCNDIISKKLTVKKEILERNEAEKKYGFRLYQGGAVPGKVLRIVSIAEDSEACGGLHADNTGEIEKIKILKTEKIQDGIIRIEIAAGKKIKEYYKRFSESKLNELKPKIEKYKINMQEIKRNIANFIENEQYADLENMFAGIESKISEKIKSERKKQELLAKESAEKIIENLKFENAKNRKILVSELEGNMKQMQKISRILSSEDTVILLFSANEKIEIFGSAGKNTGIDIGKIVSECCRMLEGKGGGSQSIAQGFGTNKDKLKETIEKAKKDILKEIQ